MCSKPAQYGALVGVTFFVGRITEEVFRDALQRILPIIFHLGRSVPVAEVVDLLHHSTEVKSILFLLLAPAERILDVWDGSLETLYDGVRVAKDAAANGTGVLTHVAAAAASSSRRGSSRRRGHAYLRAAMTGNVLCFFLLFEELACGW